MQRRGFLLAAGVTTFGTSTPTVAAPLVVHDALGRVVTISAPPQRIVPIFASNTEIAASLGLADRIVGIEAYTRFPPEVLDRPLVGGRLGFSVDAVVALRPDLLLVTPSRQAANQLIDPMERLGIPIVVLLQRSVAEILSNIRLMALIAGIPARGDDVATRLVDPMLQHRHLLDWTQRTPPAQADQNASPRVPDRRRVADGVRTLGGRPRNTTGRPALHGSRSKRRNATNKPSSVVADRRSTSRWSSSRRSCTVTGSACKNSRSGWRRIRCEA